MAIFIIIAGSLITGIWQSSLSNRLGGEQSQAMFLSSEAVEAVHSLRDRGWSNLTLGNFGIGISGNQWILVGTTDISLNTPAKLILVTLIVAAVILLVSVALSIPIPSKSAPRSVGIFLPVAVTVSAPPNISLILKNQSAVNGLLRLSITLSIFPVMMMAVRSTFMVIIFILPAMLPTKPIFISSIWPPLLRLLFRH